MFRTNYDENEILPVYYGTRDEKFKNMIQTLLKKGNLIN